MDYATVNDQRHDDDECIIVTVLRNVYRENNPSWSKNVDLDHDGLIKYGYNEFIFALCNNTQVQSIDNLSVNKFLQYTGVGADNFMNFVRESRSLRSIHLCSYFSIYSDILPSEDTTEPFLRQIAEAVIHNSHIEDIVIHDDVVVAPNTMGRFFTSSIKSFSVYIWDMDGTEGMELLLTACRTNQTMEKLSLFHEGKSDADTVAVVVMALTGHPNIRKLRLSCNGTVCHHRPLMTSIASYVGQTVSLKHLHLGFYFFKCEDLMLLLDRLSVCRLTMRYCRLDVPFPTFQKLVSYVQTSRTLKELALSGFDRHMIDTGGASPAYKDLLIGSNLQVLDLSCAADVNVHELFMALGASSDNIQLPCLHLGYINRCAWRTLIDHLPSQIYLRELHVGSVPTAIDAKYFIGRIKQNGSLHSVFFTIGSESVRLKESEKEAWESVCTRNRKLDVLLQQYNGLNDNHLALLPTLLHSASKVQRTGPNWIFIGLLSINNSTFPTSDLSTVVNVGLIAASSTSSS